MKQLKVFIVLTGIFISVSTFAQSNSGFKFPESKGCVSDFEGILKADEIATLSKIIQDYQEGTSNEIVVLTTRSIKPYKSISSYAKGLAKSWQIGEKGKNNGVYIVFSRKMRKIEIHVDSGLKDKISEKEADMIIKGKVFPQLRKRNIPGGIKNGLVEVIKELEG